MTVEEAQTAYDEAQKASQKARKAVSRAKEKVREAEAHFNSMWDAERAAWVALRDARVREGTPIPLPPPHRSGRRRKSSLNDE